MQVLSVVAVPSYPAVRDMIEAGGQSKQRKPPIPKNLSFYQSLTPNVFGESMIEAQKSPPSWERVFLRTDLAALEQCLDSSTAVTVP